MPFTVDLFNAPTLPAASGATAPAPTAQRAFHELSETLNERYAVWGRSRVDRAHNEEADPCHLPRLRLPHRNKRRFTR
jgi:hypothetical protein